MLPEFLSEPRKLPWQPKLVENKRKKLHRFQFCTRYDDNICLYGRVFWVSEFKYANRNFKVAKGVAIATKCRPKNPKMHKISVPCAT